MKSFKLSIIFLTFFFCISCNKLGINFHSQKTPDKLNIPEPLIINSNVKTDFTDFIKQKKHLSLNHYIHFNELDKLKEATLITLATKTHCIADKNQKPIEGIFSNKIKPSISIRELLPHELFLTHEDNNPICSFSFHAKHENGHSHYFKLPPTYISDFSDKHKMKIISPSGNEINKEFPYVLLNDAQGLLGKSYSTKFIQLPTIDV